MLRTTTAWKPLAGGATCVIASRISATTRSMYERSVLPWLPDGVPTQISDRSACSTASDADVVARRRPLCAPVAMSSTIPGSTTGLSPALIAATLASSTSTPTTECPLWARPAAVTVPT